MVIVSFASNGMFSARCDQINATALPNQNAITPIVSLFIIRSISHYSINKSWLGSKELTRSRLSSLNNKQIFHTINNSTMPWVTCEYCEFEYKIPFSVNGSTDSIMSKCPRCSKRNGEQFLREQFKKYTGKDPEYVDMGV